VDVAGLAIDGDLDRMRDGLPRRGGRVRGDRPDFCHERHEPVTDLIDNPDEDGW